MGEQEIKALTEGFKNLTQTLTEAPATGPLINLEKFDPETMVASEWIKEFEEASTLSNYNDQTRFSRFPFYLKLGPAKQWHILNKMSFQEWVGLRKGFLTEFTPEDEKWSYEQKLRNRKFRFETETLICYHYAVVDLCRKVDPKMSDKTKVYYLLNGLDSRMRNQLALFDLKTPEDVLAKFKLMKFDVPNRSSLNVLATMANPEKEKSPENRKSEDVEFEPLFTAMEVNWVEKQIQKAVSAAKEEFEKTLLGANSSSASTGRVFTNSSHKPEQPFSHPYRGSSRRVGRGRGDFSRNRAWGSRGGFREGYPADFQGSTSNRTEREVVRCTFCTRQGHLEEDCWNKKEAMDKARKQAEAQFAKRNSVLVNVVDEESGNAQE